MPAGDMRTKELPCWDGYWFSLAVTVRCVLHAVAERKYSLLLQLLLLSVLFALWSVGGEHRKNRDGRQHRADR